MHSHAGASAGQIARKCSAVIAVGGTGRGDLAPYSDIDLLFLESGREVPSRFAGWCHMSSSPAGTRTSNSATAFATIGDCVTLARQDAEIATALTEARLLWGSEDLFESMQAPVPPKVVDRRRRQFVDDCLAARAARMARTGCPRTRIAAQRQAIPRRPARPAPDALARIRTVRQPRDIDSLRLKGAITSEEAGMLRGAVEFLTRIRIDLHLARRTRPGRAQLRRAVADRGRTRV